MKAAFFVVALLAGCSSASAVSPIECTFGEVRPCACGDGASSHAECLSTNRWGVCDCATADAATGPQDAGEPLVDAVAGDAAAVGAPCSTGDPNACSALRAAEASLYTTTVGPQIACTEGVCTFRCGQYFGFCGVLGGACKALGNSGGDWCVAQ